jgi:hypothetical protein
MQVYVFQIFVFCFLLVPTVTPEIALLVAHFDMADLTAL